MEYYQLYSSPLGRLLLVSDGDHITGLRFEDRLKNADALPADHGQQDLPVFAETRRWLDLYFSGQDPGFSPPIALQATDFRREVWNILLTIPYGKTMTYGEIAEKIAAENGLSRMSAQAVGGAVGHNPIPLIIPCHRVIGSDGSLTGYGGGLDRKQALLDLENRESAEDEAFEVFEEMCRELHGLNDA